MSINKMLCFGKFDMRFHGNAFELNKFAVWNKKWSLFCLSIMIFTDSMGMNGKKYQPLRLSTNSAETSAVWLLVTFYFYVDFILFKSCSQAEKIFLHEMRTPLQLYTSLNSFQQSKSMATPVKKHESNFWKMLSRA